MNVWDIILIVALVVIGVIAARSAFRKDKSCCGESSCSGCTGDCSQCKRGM